MICQFLPDLRGGSGEADVGPRGVQVKRVAEFRERRARAGGGGPARRRGALGRGLGYSTAARADLFERLPTYLIVSFLPCADAEEVTGIYYLVVGQMFSIVAELSPKWLILN